ncbi:MAG: TldD/PmbA family protein [Mesorhizobium sp.]|nr:MAG: TldD/PmbA family protein [Mesorhizobium sp.]
MTNTLDAGKLTGRVAALVEAAKRAGADAADAVAVRGRSAGVSVRLGKVEGTESSESEDVSLRVFVGQRVASVSATAASDPKALAERAVAMARVSPEDPFQGLADPALLARNLRDLDLFDPTEVSADQLKEAALAAEAAALAVKGVTAGQGTAMERDYEFSSRQHFADLDAPEEIGRKAGERAVRRLGARKAATGPVDVVFDPRVARGIAGHLAGAINGAAVARKTSFLRDMMGKQVTSSAITVTDEPLRRRGQASRPFDGEGVEGDKLLMVDRGVLNHWFLSTSAARELGLVTNGRGSRSGSSVSPSSTNLAIEPGDRAPEELIASLQRGFYVTEVFGQGVDMVTGEYSRGASGFWIENGALAYPVAEVTIASNLKAMFLNMVPASDLDRNFGTAAPTLLIEGMTLAGA